MLALGPCFEEYAVEPNHVAQTAHCVGALGAGCNSWGLTRAVACVLQPFIHVVGSVMKSLTLVQGSGNCGLERLHSEWQAWPS